MFSIFEKENQTKDISVPSLINCAIPKPLFQMELWIQTGNCVQAFLHTKNWEKEHSFWKHQVENVSEGLQSLCFSVIWDTEGKECPGTGSHDRYKSWFQSTSRA